MDAQTYVFFGIMGSGKGTQVELLKTLLKEKSNKEIVYIGMGEEFRKLNNLGNCTSDAIRELHDNGILVPDFLTNAIVTNIFISSLGEEKHLVMEGYPRTVSQSEEFIKMMEFYGRKNIKVIYIDVSKEEAKKRNLLRGRKDDTDEGIAKRINMFFDDVVPAMNYFKDKEGYTIYTINGEQSVEDVHKDIIKALNF